MTTPPVFLLDTGLPQSGTVLLEGAEGRHAATVRRLRPGEVVDVVDGAGGRARCRVETVIETGLRLTVEERSTEPVPQPWVVVVQALAKGDRGEQAVEMLTEVGVDEVVPWAAGRSVVEWRGPRGDRALERWRAIARESAKQSRRARFPVVAPLATTKQVAARLRGAASGLVLHEDAPTALAARALAADGEVVIVVGPEGGITPEELTAFADAGAHAVRLGPSVLRTSTAGVVAAALTLARVRWDDALS